MASSPDITHLLIDWSRGDAHIQGQLLPLVYAKLHAIAALHVPGTSRSSDIVRIDDDLP